MKIAISYSPTTISYNLNFISFTIRKHSLQMALMMVVKEGLGKPAGSEKVQVAGATATSQISVSDEESDTKTLMEYSVEFCGFFPADAPKYSIIVSMNKRGLPASGGLMAGTVFSEIVDFMMEREK